MAPETARRGGRAGVTAIDDCYGMNINVCVQSQLEVAEGVSGATTEALLASIRRSTQSVQGSFLKRYKNGFRNAGNFITAFVCKRRVILTHHSDRKTTRAVCSPGAFVEVAELQEACDRLRRL